MKYYLVAIALIVLSLMTCTYVHCANTGKLVGDFAMPRTHAIIIDAGSTGSRVSLFTFHDSVDGQLVLDDSLYHGIKPGLSAFAKHPKDVKKSLKILLDKAKTRIPPAQRASTPMFLRATAGLRLLPENEAQAILDECKRVFASSGFKVTDDSVAIMDGADEGIFSWITTNFLLGKLDDLESSVATLDLGGGSNQVTFFVAPDAIPKQSPQAKHIYRVNVLGKNISLFSVSFLGMGLNAARERILTHPDNPRRKGSKVTSECVSPSVSKKKWHYRGTTYVVDGPKGREVGGLQLDKCIGIINKVVHSAIPHKLPSLKEHEIYAFSNYFKSAIKAGLVDSAGGIVTVESFHKLASQVCESSTTHRPFMCLDLSYIYVLLHDGFGLDKNSSIVMRRNINGHRLTWALGAAFKLLQNNM